MKFNNCVTSDQSKDYKRLFSTFPHSKELKLKYHVQSMPIRMDDEVQVVQGHYKGQQTDKVVQVYRKKYVIYTCRSASGES